MMSRPAPMARSAPMRASRNVSAPQMHSNRAISPKTYSRGNAERAVANNRVHPGHNAKAFTNVNPRGDATVNGGRNYAGTAYTGKSGAAGRGAAAVAPNNNVRTTNHAVVAHRGAVVNNWQGVSGQNYAPFRDYQRQWHDRSWWRSHYDTIILVGGGWWYWNAGYWYPAWGYDPSYTYYPYDGPIYGYNHLRPDQVVVDVQTQLQADGYYAGPIDGVLGPQTRRAISAFQVDHGLAVTSAVDEPTLATLGLT